MGSLQPFRAITPVSAVACTVVLPAGPLNFLRGLPALSEDTEGRVGGRDAGGQESTRQIEHTR
eukprot:2150137-Alexandrium_andersonii.AAC.1